jgi:DNA repair photolyase
VRWENLTIEAEERSRLPGYREPATVRHFDAPEAMDVRFYEVRARSVLNRVPERSRMPFRWTINPYRGCSHACTYCSRGDTQVLLPDGLTKAIRDLRFGDEILGTKRIGAYRRLIPTMVLDQWSTIKPAYRVTLAEGTELVVSGDHRFLTGRGWKFVTGAEQGRDRRPHLTLGSRMLGVGGGVNERPRESSAYRRGYLCGLIRGDGLLKTYSYERPIGRMGDLHNFRLALTDREALDRAQLYLAAELVAVREFRFSARTETRRPLQAIANGSREAVETVRELCRWPLDPSDDWRLGFLAGIFDAEGSCGDHVIRIHNADPTILRWTVACLEHFGFDAVVEDRGLPNGLCVVRLRGGLGERLRFFQTTDPAITRKNRLVGRALKTTEDLRVVSIEPLGRAERLYDITTGTGDFIANGVVSHNCFARPTHKYLDMDAGRDFEREIVVKVNAPEVLRTELARPSWRREHVALGTNTDPYQWVEGRYELMRGIWSALRDAANPCSVLTKSPLLLRDLDLMRELDAVTAFSANVSVPTIDEKAWRATEPRTPNPRARLEAVAELTRAGIATGVLVAPIMPGINDDPRQVEAILEAASEAGATSIGGIALHLRGEVRQIFFDWLRAHRPDLVERYEELYRRGAYVPRAEADRIQGLLRAARRPEVELGVSRRMEGAAAEAGDRTEDEARPAPAGNRQEVLF